MSDLLRPRIHPIWRASSALGSCDVLQVRLGTLETCGCPPAGRLRALVAIFMNSSGYNDVMVMLKVKEKGPGA